jgi:DNA-binding XRE family transcriptional regulator
VTAHSPETNPAHLLADLLRTARQQEPGRTQEVLASVLGKERSTVGKVEQGRVPAHDVLNDWLTACEVHGLAETAVRGLWQLAKNAEDPTGAAIAPWYDVEARAHTLRFWQPVVVPGILQSERYAYEMYRVGGRSHERALEEVAGRMQRQLTLSRDDAPTVVVVLDQMVLERFIGSAQVMAEQCAKLLELPPSVLLHVLPSSLGANPGLGGAISLASVAGEPDILLTGSLLEDRVTVDPAQVRAASATFERVRAVSANIMDTADTIRKAQERWTA